MLSSNIGEQQEVELSKSTLSPVSGESFFIFHS